MFTWIDTRIQRERYSDYVRAAEHERLVRQLPAKRETAERLYDRLLALLGNLLIAAGQHLQARHGDAARLDLHRLLAPTIDDGSHPGAACPVGHGILPNAG
jgi:hypothetical protein